MSRSTGESSPFFAMEQCTVTFGGLTAVRELTFSLQAHDLVGLIGPNGAGKTTVFNLVTGVYVPTAGRIVFEGKPVANLRGSRMVSRSRRDIARSGICRTFQNIRLFGGLSVLENVLIAANSVYPDTLAGAMLRTTHFYRTEAAAHAFAEELLRALGLAEFAGQVARSLPYGAQRRLEIARALATRPRLLLLDEPAAGMNPRESEALVEMIRWVRQAYDLAILLIEHDMKVVMGLCERVLVLENGALIADGKPEAVQTDPRVISAYLGEPDA